MHELCRELIARGVHQIDAGDAVNDADRKWLARGRPNSGRNLIATGEANDEKEVFEFTVEPFVSGGFLLSIRYHGDCCQNVTGGGVWPTVEKAKQIAQESATKLLHGATISWKDHPYDASAQVVPG